jgi:hypothetical protein
LIRDVPPGAIDTLLALLWASGPIRVASPRRHVNVGTTATPLNPANSAGVTLTIRNGAE